jgi:hypothetical protein
MQAQQLAGAVRVHPDPNYRLTPAAIIEEKDDREVYLVTPQIALTVRLAHWHRLQVLLHPDCIRIRLIQAERRQVIERVKGRIDRCILVLNI